MKLTLFSPNAFTTLILPAKCAGQYWLCGRDHLGHTVRVAAVEGIRPISEDAAEQWVLCSNSQYQVIGPDGSVLSRVPLEALSVHRLRKCDHSLEYRLYTEPLSDDRKTYRAYEVLGQNVSLTIGRAPQCHIRYNSAYIGKLHATLQFSGAGFTVTDHDSLNRTFVNGVAVSQARLRPGDTASMMGMQIIIGGRNLYINNPDGNVAVDSPSLRRCSTPAPLPARAEQPEPEVFDDYYYRSPRFKFAPEPFTLTLDAPPTGHTADKTPLFLSVAPAITMGLTSASTAVFSVVNAAQSGDPAAAIPSAVMSISMLCGTLLWPNLAKRYQKQEAEQKEAQRQKAYSQYLANQERRIQTKIANQEKLLRENDSSTADCLSRFREQPPRIWERTPKHTDFLRLRLGLGQLPLQATIQCPARRFAVEHDALTEAMYQFGEKKRWLRDVPICLPLTERRVSGFYAEHRKLLTYAKSLLLQLMTLYSYDEVKLVVLYDPSDEEELSFVRWLPHTADAQRRVRYIATTAEEAKQLSADLEPILESRRSRTGSEQDPHYVVVCLNKKLAARTDFLHTVLEEPDLPGFHVIAMYDRLKDLPKECSAVVGLDGSGNGTLTLLGDVCEQPVSFRCDVPERLDLRAAAAVLANTLLDTGDAQFRLPKTYPFLQMLDAGMVEHLNLLENWSASDPTKSLAAPIGIDRFGEPFMLDLHQKAHGPHGLIAGMTGSGKSELIISYILSMALRYHPDEVSFILIDYKGGGMAKAFEKIPHTAGIITNLDGSEINRSLVSLQSELHRRERIFRDVSAAQGISNIDIYKYQKLYRQGRVSEPMPHLIIISDEFAELKKDQPVFMDSLTSTARVGRSLGVHLILATQKPGGVVDDQIRSNSRFRLCLKVQDRGDSTEMLGRPEAAALTDVGRFFLQVGSNEIFALGQSAWAGAAYHPAPMVIPESDDSVCVIDTNGQILSEVRLDRYPDQKDAPKQLDVITEHICQVCEREQIRRRSLWLDSIPARIYVEQLLQKYPSGGTGGFRLAPIIGEYDDPASQYQGLLRLPLTDGGNTIVYGSAGSGKAMFLEAMCCSLIREHTPDEVNLYLLDFGAETLTAFADAPHVGDVILSHEEEKLRNLFKLLHRRLQTRRKLLARHGGSLEQYNARSDRREPGIVVVIHNFAAFSELYEEQLSELSRLTREGTLCGIYFVLTCTGVNNVRLNLLQNFKNLYCLQLNTPDDYTVVLGKTGGLLPAKAPGRGLFRRDKDSVLEFQTASVTPDENPYPFLRSFCRQLAARTPGSRAEQIPVLPETVSVPFLAQHADPGDLRSIPVGVEKETLRIARLDLAARPVHMVLSQGREWLAFTDALARLLSGTYRGRTIVLAPGAADSDLIPSDTLELCTGPDACVRAVYDIFGQVLQRNNRYKTALKSGEPVPEFEPLYVIIQSVSALHTLLAGSTARVSESDDDSPLLRLSLALEKAAAAYRVYFILADSEQGLRTLSSNAWYRQQLSKQDLIWIGGGLHSQYWLNITEKPQDFTAPVAPPFGYAVRSGAAVPVKFPGMEEV